MLFQLCLEGCFGELFDQRRENTILAIQVLARTKGFESSVKIKIDCHVSVPFLDSVGK